VNQGYFEGDDQIDGDDDAANVLGQVARQLVRRPVRGAGGRPIFRQPPLPRVPAQPNEAELRSFVGMGFQSWGPADVVDRVFEIEPQESFRGERLVIDTREVGGVAAGLLFVRRIEVGTMPQSPSVTNVAPIAMFRPDATGAELDLQIAYRGTKLIVTLGVTAAPGAGVTVTALVGFYGQWIR
jgi:hypothetical protein